MDCYFRSIGRPGVKCGSADVRILNVYNADVAADENLYFTHARNFGVTRTCRENRDGPSAVL